jgi:hypothetical protein
MTRRVRRWQSIISVAVLVMGTSSAASAETVRLGEGAFFEAVPETALDWYTRVPPLFGSASTVSARLFTKGSSPPAPSEGDFVDTAERVAVTRTFTGSGTVFIDLWSAPEEQWSILQSSFRFTGPDFVIPPSFPPGPPNDEDLAFVRQPFSMTGWFTVAHDGITETVDVFGSGQAHLGLFPNRASTGAKIASIGYSFHDVAPVPEPATLTLLAIGIVGTVAGAARKRRICSPRDERHD